MNRRLYLEIKKAKYNIHILIQTINGLLLKNKPKITRNSIKFYVSLAQ